MSAPFLLSAPALQARVYKHDFSFANVRWQKLQSTAPEALHIHQHLQVPLAQLEGVEAVEEASSVTPIEAPPATDLVFVGLGLLLIFWIGSVVVPEFIFSKVFKQEESKQDAATAARQSLLDGIAGGSKDSGGSSKQSLDEGSVKGTGGFGKSPRLKK
ncbi:hypothetical protein GOP47_0016218 [Adiantum capillus-veneris]|uniref:Uncharacterized protein n=1 Tax=Adiantum capillus-veneris TaxID=13818 RepID=A0A9D4UH73_ADICA|nr:hypothetical protein GOP47_0016218 [Adiantum capillus-veneris]